MISISTNNQSLMIVLMSIYLLNVLVEGNQLPYFSSHPLRIHPRPSVSLSRVIRRTKIHYRSPCY